MMQRIEGFLGKSVDGKKSRIPALQDLAQSITGLILACFMICHMIFTGTILFGTDAFESVVKFAEPGGIYQVTNFVALVILIIFMVHAFTAMRKFPANYAAYRAFKAHKIRMRHCDTTLWWFQFITGFLLFFFASAHILTIVFGEKITPDLSIGRFSQLHIFYLLLLIVTVLHASIGTYRLIMKWVSIDGTRAEAHARRKLIKTINFIVWGVFFLLSVIADVVWLSLG
ncbi:fumarate reductase cytochrome b subunit [Campylobacter geochelonis]|uniref:Fumarate reductase cytochrome b subunit n=1 Tax=Campylobacter geochelonis TaxID=1780362 RepID=A0A128EQW7_9BACT|nr:fumarate reductase cytochrome b subunit [Campylobacter geochelonis]QKF71427.1 fumarate reductase, cytochrome b subunit [Campylobacter geochelonis]CZE48364.1 fumarate reductase respiratory complex%2C transmembrane subunit [Campylobacter geochelonis]CZE50865.1 fumarate reductase respiratory complex%2C transmembrane subunit [Campylobacter geochelonis]